MFVVGVWRSGTSLLQSLMNQHSRIGLAYEAELPLLRSLFLGGHAKADWLPRWEFWNSALSRHRLAAGDFPAGDYDLRSATALVYQRYAASKGADIWGEKSPNYWDCLDQVAQDFPNARFIVIFRSPLGVCRSVLDAARTQSYFAHSGMGLRALFACRELKLQRDLLRHRGVPVHEVQYEELIRDPEQVLSGVCGFLNVPFEPRMTSLENADRSSIYAGQHHSLVKGDRIVASRERAEILSPEFKAKINSYINLWREQDHGWPLYPAAPVPPGKPGLWEQATDAAKFWLLRRFDSVVAMIYCWAPLPLLSAYRSRKRNPADGSGSAGSETPRETKETPQETPKETRPVPSPR